MMSILRLTISQVAIVCERSQDVIKKWVAENMFDNYVQVKNGFIFYGNTKVKCFTLNGETLTLGKIAQMNKITLQPFTKNITTKKGKE